jgi:hypothetical protein
MAHFTKLNSENIVTEILVVGDGDILKADGTQSELKGKQFLNSLFGTATWKQTFEDGSSRKNYAGIGYTYDSERDAFIAPKPYNSWTLNETTCQWESPLSYPSDGKHYSWNESNIVWELIS